MKKILSISNSFGVDATRYLYQIARAGGERLKVVTLYIGGCSLQLHYENVQSDAKAYDLYVNGANSGFKVSIDEALTSNDWDVIALQQSSPKSGDEQSYYPYIEKLSEHARKLAPNAKIYVHQTWAYPENSEMFNMTPFKTREEMNVAVKSAYVKASLNIGADGIIPSLVAMDALYNQLGEIAYRDALHASYGIGRYTLGCVWYATLFLKNPVGNSYCDLDREADKEQILIAQTIAKNAVEKYGYKLV